MSTNSPSSSDRFEGHILPSRSDTGARYLALGCVILASTHRYWWRSVPDFSETFLALMGLIAVVMARNGRVDGLGLNYSPRQGWRYWFRFTFWIALVLGVIIAATSAVLWFGHFHVRIARMAPSELRPMAPYMIVYAPIFEELLFRSLLCFALRPTLGIRTTIIVSGALFALMHWPGNPGPDNQVAGFVLAYVYLRSESLAVPIAMHAGGNAFAVACQVFNWHFLPELTPG